MSIAYEVGDCVELVNKSVSNNPPVGTKGLISSLYTAMGGPAAQIAWFGPPDGSIWNDRAFLKDLKSMETEIDESDESLDVLFEGMT